MRDVSNKNDSKQKDGRLFTYLKEHKVEIAIAIFTIISTILVVAYVIWQILYCIDHPDCEMCEMKNMTGIIKSLTCR